LVSVKFEEPMYCRRTDSRRTQRGAALILAMLVFALASALIVGLQREFTLTLQRGTHQLFSEQAWAYLIGAEQLAVLALRADSQADARSESPVDHLGELWAQPPTPYPLDAGGWMSGELEDLQGRFNVNALLSQSGKSAAGNGEVSATEASAGSADEVNNDLQPAVDTGTTDAESRWTPAQKVLVRLLQSLGEASLKLEEAMALTESIIDFIDADSERRANGAESGEYRYAEFPYLPANRPLASVSELRAVKGMTLPVYEALAPLVTVWPEEGGGINILTAPLPVLRSLNADDVWQPLPEIEGERLGTLRAEGEIARVEDFLSDPVLEGRPSSELETLITTRSEWFLLDANVELAGQTRHLRTVLHRSAGETLAVFRSEGEL